METYFDPELNPNPEVQFYIIDMKKGDVTGDGVIDEVYLLGTKPSNDKGPNFFDDITVAIVDGKIKKTTYLRFKFNAGYNPKLLLTRFTDNPSLDIFLVIQTPSEPGKEIYYLFSAVDNKLKSLFNFLAFDEYSEYRVVFNDNYIVTVTNIRSGKTFIIDISFRPKSYLSTIYDSNGKTKGIYEGDVLSLGILTPIDINFDGVNELLAIQKIVGISNKDVLGYVQTFLKFNGNEFIPDATLVSIQGTQVNLPKVNTPTTNDLRKKKK
ncbi:MAG: VCBS repeat-containing protein [Clostridium sp.]